MCRLLYLARIGHSGFHISDPLAVKIGFGLLDYCDRVDLAQVVDQADRLDAGGKLVHQLEHLVDRDRIRGTGDVAFGGVRVLDQFGRDRVGYRRKDQWNVGGCCRRRDRGRGGDRDDQVFAVARKFLADRIQIGLVALCVLVVDFHLVRPVTERFHFSGERVPDLVQRSMFHDLCQADPVGVARACIRGCGFCGCCRGSGGGVFRRGRRGSAAAGGEGSGHQDCDCCCKKLFHGSVLLYI